MLHQVFRRSRKTAFDFSLNLVSPCIKRSPCIATISRNYSLPKLVSCNMISTHSVRRFSSLPAHKVVAMPSLSPTMESGAISKWNLKEGDRFEPGTSLCDVETDKAVVSFDATDEGYLAKILVGSGDVKVGQPLLVTVDEAADVAAFASFTVSASASATNATPAPAALSKPLPQETKLPPAPVVSSTPTSTDRIFASPLARKLIRESNSNLEHVFTVLGGKGSGPNNRIVAADVLKASSMKVPDVINQPKVEQQATTSSASHQVQSAKPTNAPVNDVFVDFEISEASKEVAARLTHSKQAVPHYYVSVELNLTELLKIRDQFNSKLLASTKEKTAGEGLSVLDFVVKAAAVAVKQIPDVNASWMETFVRRYDQVDINLVMGSGSRLAAPVLRDVGSRGILSISDEIAELESSLYSNVQADVDKLLSDEKKLAPGTMSIHNLGVYGIKSAAPIVLPPQGCALALGTITDTVIPCNVKDGSDKDWTVAPIMIATLSCDHRVVDGAISAQYLAAFKQLVENPMNLLL